MKEETIKIELGTSSMSPISVKGDDTSVTISDSHSGGQSNNIYLRYDELLQLKTLIERYIKKVEKFKELKEV